LAADYPQTACPATIFRHDPRSRFARFSLWGQVMMLRAAVFALAAAMLAAPALAPSALAQAPADGVWKGTGLQVGADGVQSTWTIRMTIRQHGRSEIEYPSLGCKGELTQIANGVEGFEFNERITDGKENCIDRGRIVVKQRSGRVFWFWYMPGGGPADASAVLYRDDLYAGVDGRAPSGARTPRSAGRHS
jgi:hypothetical protein